MHGIVYKLNEHIPARLRCNKVVGTMLIMAYQILLKADPELTEQLNVGLQFYEEENVSKRVLKHDMMKEFVFSWIRPHEYAKFDFLRKSVAERATFIGGYEAVYVFKRIPGNNILPDSKFKRYLMFRDFFRRKALCVSPENPVLEDDYNSFISGESAIVVKPLKGTKGQGVTVVNTDVIPNLIEFKKHFQFSCLLEENIRQGEELKRFHPNSVNTVRFVTGIDYFGNFHFLFALLRTGRGGSVVDNVASGGLVALIDLEDGTICTPAYCGTDLFEIHPDTGIKFQGSKIPDWEALKSLVKKMHLTYPDQRVFGFDMAWSNNGWDLVEVNPAPSLTSYEELTGQGIRPFLQSINIIN